MGGNIHVQSNLGEGSDFYFNLEFETVSTPQMSEGLRPLPESDQKLKVMVIDESDLNKVVMAELFDYMNKV